MTNNMNVEESNETASVARDMASKYLSFRATDREYGMKVLKIHKIVGITDILLIRRMQASVSTVIDLCSRASPAVDLCARFGLEGLISIRCFSGGEAGWFNAD